MQAPAPSPENDADERKRARLAAALFGFVAIVQLLAMLSRGVRNLFGEHGPSAAFPHLAIVLPAGAFAVALWTGRRLRVATILFALLWSLLSAWAAILLARLYAHRPDVDAFVASHVARRFVPVVIARSIAFTAATIVLVTGRPGRTRRWVGAALGIVFALLFAAEHAYQNVPWLRF